jgi:hypothetical protein
MMKFKIFWGVSGGKTIPVRLKDPQNIVGKKPVSDVFRNIASR